MCKELKQKFKRKFKSIDRWLWMMGYCERQGIPASQEWAWNEAGKEYGESRNETK